MASHHHLLLTQLLGHVLGAVARHIDPGLAEEDGGGEKLFQTIVSQLDDGHEAHAGPDVARLSVHASHHMDTLDSVCAPLIKALCLLLRNVAHLDQTCVWKRRINRD